MLRCFEATIRHCLISASHCPCPPLRLRALRHYETFCHPMISRWLRSFPSLIFATLCLDTILCISTSIIPHHCRLAASVPFLFSVRISWACCVMFLHPLSGSTCAPATCCLQSGHSVFSLTQSRMHLQQKACPQVVTLGSLIGSKNSVHFLPWGPGIHPITLGSPRSYRAFPSPSPSGGGVWVIASNLGLLLVLSIDVSVVYEDQEESRRLSRACKTPCTIICIASRTPRTS